MKKLFTLLGLFLTVIRVSALDFTVGDFTFTTLEDNKVAVTGCSLPYNSDVVIPATVTYENINYTITKIHDLPYNRFRSLYIPETVEIINRDLYNYGGIYCILEEFIVHPDNQFFKAIDGCLYSKDGTKFIACPFSSKNVIVAEGTIEISLGAFHTDTRELESVILPKSLEIIGQQAFAQNKLKSIYIPENVKVIKNDAFYSCPIDTLEISSDNQFLSEFDGGVYSKDYSKLIVFPVNKKTVSFHPNVSSLEEFVFSGNQMIEEIVIPNTIKSIPQCTFYNCRRLKKVVIPESVESIDRSAFTWCNGLEYLIIPKSVQSLSIYAFHSVVCPIVIHNPDIQLSDITLVKGLNVYAKGNTYSTLKDGLRESTVLPLPEKIFSFDSFPVHLTANSWTGISTIMNIQPACGFQADMTFPEGLSMIDVKIAGDFSADSVKISYSQLENGDYRLIGYTVDGSMMPDDITVIFYVRSDENFKRSKILIHDAVLSIYDNEYKCEDQEWRMAGYVIRPFMPETMEEGETHTLPNPIEGAPDNVTYRFVSSNTNIITVDGNTLTAQAPGNVRVIIDVEDEGINTLLGYDIEVLAALWGDADGSEAIDVADIVAMVNHILGRSSENFNSRLADIDRNGRINIADLTALIRIILTQPQAESVAVNSRAMADNVNREVSFGEAEDLGGDYLRVPVELDVTADYSAMQGEIVIPEGMSLEKMQLAGELGKHTLDYAMVGDNRARFVIYSISLASLPADRKSAVASVTLHGRTTSDDVLCLNDAIVCDNDCVTYSLGSATMTFEGMSGLDALRASGFVVRAVRSGIELTAPAETSARITDLSGRTVAEVAAPTRVSLPAGLYIVSFTDGPVMKVIVK